MKLQVILGAALIFTALSTVNLLWGLALSPLEWEAEAEERKAPEDPYEVGYADFIAGIKAMERFSTTGRFVWSTHGALEAARWGEGRRLRVMVVGQLHGREMFSAELVRLWMLSMLTARNPDAGRVEWMMVPSASPCGRDLVAEGYASLRSFRGVNRTKDWQVCKRTSCTGVDLNRNWATERGLLDAPDEDRVHWDRSPENNPGDEAFSEPETFALRLLLHDYAPHILLNIHTGTVGIKAPPEDGSSQKPLNLPKLMLVKAWMEMKSNCCIGRPRMSSKISQGSMTDYAARRIMTPAPLTLEVFKRDPVGSIPLNNSRSAAEYVGSERWGDDPNECFSFFNPPSHQIVAAATPWLRIWRALFYLSDRDLKILEGALIE